MCLYVDQDNKKRIRFVNGIAKLWKVVRVDTEVALTGIFQDYTYTPGYNYPEYPLENIENLSFVEGGVIHVCTSFKEANRKAGVNSKVRKIIPIYVKKKDLVAIGCDDDAVFTKIFIYKKDYNAALKLYGQYKSM